MWVKLIMRKIRLHAARNKLLRAMGNPKDFRPEPGKEEKTPQICALITQSRKAGDNGNSFINVPEGKTSCR